jgi:glycerol-3-phosphate acyltransferase PlsY
MILLIGKIILLFVISYLIGSIPTGYIIVKLLKGIDVRTIGSGSTGATNVKRVLGTKWFFIVMFLDALKGAIPVLIGYHSFNFINFIGLGPVIAAVGAIIGHSKSIFLKFSGGKSVATGVGTILALCWPVGVSIAVIWALITYTTKYVSLGSVVAISLAPLLMNAFNQNIYYICFAAIGAIYVIILHKENIKRLLEGKENKVRK